MGNGLEYLEKKLKNEYHLDKFRFFLLTILVAKSMQRTTEWSSELKLNLSGTLSGSLKSQVNLATIYGESEKLHLSEILLSNALARKPSSDIFYNIGLIQQKTKRISEAKKSYNECLKLR